MTTIKLPMYTNDDVEYLFNFATTTNDGVITIKDKDLNKFVQLFNEYNEDTLEGMSNEEFLTKYSI
jgi:hypothetical protein